MSTIKEKIPTTLDEAVLEVVRIVPEDVKNKIKEGKDELTNYHRTLGMQLRNAWGLWSGSELKNWFINEGLFHADDMSGVILSKADANIKGEPFNIKEHVGKYTLHWIKQGTDVQEELKKARQ